MPDPWPEFGQCVHKGGEQPGPPRPHVPAEPPRRLPQRRRRRHVDVDRRRSPERLRLPHRGRPARPGHRLRVSPGGRRHADPAGRRRPPCGGPRDAGATWAPLTEGLPEEAFYAAVLRDAMCSDRGTPTGLYLGSRDGCLYGSADAGDSWSLLKCHPCPMCCACGRASCPERAGDVLRRRRGPGPGPGPARGGPGV